MPASAQVNLVVYGDQLSNGFQDWSWGSRNLTNTSPVHSGSHSISANLGYWQAVSFAHDDMDTSGYASLSFWLNGGANGGQVLNLQCQLSHVSQTAYTIPALKPNQWTQFTIQLTTLSVANKPDFDRFWLQLTSSGSSNIFYLDDVQFIAKPAPALTTFEINANQLIRAADARWFGINTAVWDSDLDTDWTASALNDMGTLAMRFPGGSLSDEYHWATSTSGTNTWVWATTLSKFAHLATNLGAQACITVNYGTGTPEEAAAWVKNSNITHKYGFKHWEIGNENYGSWETDTNARTHDPFLYATRAQAYITQMKAVDPTIHIGVVAVTGEDDYATYSDHPATNPRTGVQHNGWTPVLLATLKRLGVMPDFVVYHRYAQNSGGESDAALLLSSATWPNDAQDLRQQITDYFGASGTNIELLCTENNSVSSGPGKQTTSLVNALFMADSFCQLSATEFNGFFWWDLRNGQDSTFNNDSSLYGWRTYGDYGVVNAQTDRYPVYYASKMLRRFVNPGDQIVKATTDNPYLAIYAARHASGSLSLLAINKYPTNTCATRVNLNGFVPATNVSVFSYGIPQDTAVQTGSGQTDLSSSHFAVEGASLDYSFAPYSMTLLTLAPAPPALSVNVTPSQPDYIVTLHGQPNVRYVWQTSTNLAQWAAVATNTLTGDTLSITNTFSPRQKYWRAVWTP